MESVTTKKLDRLSKEYWTILVFGYIRLIIQLSIPSELKSICIDYLFGETNFKFNYRGGNEEVCDITNDGLTMAAKNGKYGTVLFGDFFSFKTNPYLNFTVLMKLDEFRLHFNGFGFATPQFKQYVTTYFNGGENHSCTFNINGYFKNSKEFIGNYQHCQSIQEVEEFVNKKEIVAININGNDKKGRVWNWTKSDSYINNKHVFQIGLPDEVGIILYFGSRPCTITVIKQFLS